MFLRSTRKNKILVFFLIFSLILGANFAQQKSKNAYLQEKKQLLQKIKNTNKILSATRKEKISSQARLNAITQQIINREQLINTLRQEVEFLNNDIGELMDVIHSMEKDLEFLTEEYQQMVYASYKAHNSFNKLSYIFASSSFNQLMMRLNYLDQFTEARHKQVNKIQAVHDMLSLRYERIESKYKEKSSALNELDSEKSNLLKLKEEQRNVVSGLSQKEQELKQKLKQYEEKQKALDKMIRKIIEKEAQKQLSKSKEAKLISKNFEANKGRLPWPLQKSFISRKFGKQPHPVLERVYVNNMGIGLQTSPNASVRAVFNGTVTTVASIPGMGKIVMIKHGEYYTVYAKMKSVNVHSGDKVSTKQIIGTVDTNSEGLTELEFQIWKSKTKVNPAPWLAR